MTSENFNSRNRAAGHSSSSSSSSSSLDHDDDDGSVGVPPRRVRFPLDNNPGTNRFHYPVDEEDGSSHENTTAATRGYNRRNSSLSTPPIVYEDDGEEGDSYFESPAMMVTRPDNSQVGIEEEEPENTDSTNYLLPHQQQPNPQLSTSVVGGNSLQNVFDVGLHTSGGLAPGSVEHDAALNKQGEVIDEEGQNAGDELKRRRDSLLQRINSLRRRSSESHDSEHSHHRGLGGPYGRGSHEGDVRLMDLDERLKKIAEETPEEIDPREIARELVRSHTLHHKDKEKEKGKEKEKDRGNKETEKDDDNEKDEKKEYMVPATDLVTEHNEYDAYGHDIMEEGDLPPPDDRARRRNNHEDYIAPPSKVKQGVLGSLLKLYNEDDDDDGGDESEKSGYNTASETPSGLSTPRMLPSSAPASPPNGRRGVLSRTSSGDYLLPQKKPVRPKLLQTKSSESTTTRNKTDKASKWYQHKQSRSTSSLGGLVISSSHAVAAPGTESPYNNKQQSRPKFTKRASGVITNKKKNKERKKQNRLEEQIRITVHIADVLQRQRFIVRMCRALMLYGAPTHRLEEYLKMTARVLEINGQFLYIPGCMIISFGDPTTHTSEMQLVRTVQGLNLTKLHKAHQIYKEVVHDILGVEEASQRVDDLLSSKNQYPVWLTLIFFGLAAAAVTPFAFGGYWPDIPISFLLGGMVGVLQIIIAPRSTLYSNVFEVTSSIFVSFLGRAIGSIGHKQDIFCFAAIAQGSLALILPGYIILCGSLELQSKNIVAGSVRMFYAIIYSLFLGFGITLGAAIYGWIDGNATSETTCKKTVSDWFKFLFVPAFTIFIASVNQANFRQLPVMVIISGAGYVVTFFTNKKVYNSSEFTSAIGAFVIGVLGNIYSRVGHGLAFAAMLPAILVQVPSGIASQGSLVAGIRSADKIVSNGTKTNIVTETGDGGTPIATVTQTATPSGMDDDGPNAFQGSGNILSLGVTMIQVSIGITVGLFVATLVIYPFGKKRSGLFTF